MNTSLRLLKLTPESASFAQEAINSNATEAALGQAKFAHQTRLLALSQAYAARKRALQEQYIAEVTAIPGMES